MSLPTLGGRRFLLTVGCGVVNAVLLWFGKLDAGSYTTLTLGTVAVYIAGNTTQKVMAPQTNTERQGGG